METIPQVDWQARTSQLLPQAHLEALWDAHVVVFGLGGVGSYAAEALCRAGVGHLTLVDADQVEASNINRQLPALHSTLGKPKVQVVGNRLRDISPRVQVEEVQAFYLPEAPVAIEDRVSYVVDAVDTVAAKIHIASTCMEKQIPIVSAMGLGNRLNPTMVRLGDLFETSGCPLCRVMRRELRRRGLNRLRCVYSVEVPQKGQGAGNQKQEEHRGDPPGSVPYVPSVAGMYMAYEVVNRLGSRLKPSGADAGLQHLCRRESMI